MKSLFYFISALVQRQRSVNIIIIVDFNESVCRMEQDSDILTGICYFHRHHAASEHEGALLV